MSQPFTRYADEVNSKYSKIESNYVDLETRLEEALNKSQYFLPIIEQIVDEFKRRHPNLKKFSDMKGLVQAIPVRFDKIRIDTTMQRPLDLTWVTDILSNFRETMCMPLQVYEQDGNYVCWEGQHTSEVWYIILTKVFGQRQIEVEVPCNIYPVSKRLEIRENYIKLNSQEGKLQVQPIDLYTGHVFGVNVDNSDDPNWIKSAEINKTFEKCGLFATAEKFGDHTQVGAFTLLSDTIMSKNPDKRKDVEVTKMFGRYWQYMNANRPVQAKEARVLYDYFDHCLKDNVKVDDKYLLEFVSFVKNYLNSNWSETGPFWSKVKIAYENWFKKSNPEAWAEKNKSNFTTEPRFGVPFLIAQMKKSTKLKTPKYKHIWAVDKEDLWND